MSNADDFNAAVIREFRENAGKVGGFFADKLLLLLHTRGARTGEARVIPLVCFEEADDLVIVASSGGAPAHPAWYHNLKVSPAVEVEFGAERFDAEAIVTREPQRSALYEKAADRYSFFGEYAEETKGIRTIPVVILKRLSQV